MMNLFDQYVKFREKYHYQKIDIDLHTIEYTMVGQGEKIIMMLIGGSMFPTEAYFLMIQELAQNYRILLINYPKQIHTLNELSNIYQKLLDKLNIKHIYLFGANHGGGVAQVFAKAYPSYIKGLILYNTISQSNDMQEEVKLIIKDLKQALNELKELRKMVSLETIKETLFEQIKVSIPDTMDHMFYEHFISLYQENEEDAHMALIKDFLEHYVFKKSDFSYLKNQTLIFYGHDIDPLGGTEFIEVLAELHANPKLIFIETDRFQLMVDPKVMVSEIKTFINQ
ncbi:MAG: alpha/beta hydrolase [Bacillota bacterium]|nr:MAG: alpha/beta hydrolase [Bacillota bacterium]